MVQHLFELISNSVKLIQIFSSNLANIYICVHYCIYVNEIIYLLEQIFTHACMRIYMRRVDSFNKRAKVKRKLHTQYMSVCVCMYIHIFHLYFYFQVIFSQSTCSTQQHKFKTVKQKLNTHYMIDCLSKLEKETSLNSI